MARLNDTKAIADLPLWGTGPLKLPELFENCYGPADPRAGAARTSRMRALPRDTSAGSGSLRSAAMYLGKRISRDEG